MLMVYAIYGYLWYLWGWFAIALRTLRACLHHAKSSPWLQSQQLLTQLLELRNALCAPVTRCGPVLGEKALQPLLIWLR